MGLLDKTKQLGSKTVDLGKKAGSKTVELGKKGVDAVRKKECSECKNYTIIDENTGNCAIAGKRFATAAASTCPQKAFAWKEPPKEGQTVQE